MANLSCRRAPARRTAVPGLLGLRPFIPSNPFVMTRVSPRAHLHSSELLRTLARQGLMGDALDAGDVGQGLAQWLSFRQAIALQGFIGSLDDPATPAPPPRARIDAGVLKRRFAEVHAALEHSIVQGSVPAPGMLRIDRPPLELDQPIDAKTAFEPYRRFAVGHQRQMDSVIRSLRVQLRRMLDQGTLQDRQLSALDVIFENVLNPRESRWLGQIPAQFEKRFSARLRQHLKAAVQAEQADEPCPASEPWLAPLFADMTAALLAELDLRLQPVLGLIEAIVQHPKPSP